MHVWAYFIGSCLEIIGLGTVFDTHGVAYICAQPAVSCWDGICVPYTGPCITTSVFAPAYQLWEDPTQCYLKVLPHDPVYDYMWEAPVTVLGVDMVTPAKSESMELAELPYTYRAQFAAMECEEWMIDFGICVRENVCTDADIVLEACTCTAAMEAEELCVIDPRPVQPPPPPPPEEP